MDIVFRTFKDGDVIALFPYEINNTKGSVTSYMRIGQHGLADYTPVVNITKLSTVEEYTPLLKELEQCGYENIRVLKRMSGEKFNKAYQSFKYG